MRPAMRGSPSILAQGVATKRTFCHLQQTMIHPSSSEPRRDVPSVVLGDVSLIRPLGKAGIRIVAVATDANDISLRSKFVSEHVIVPGYAGEHQEETFRRLIELGNRLKATHGQSIPLFYGQDKQLELIYRHRHEMESCFTFVISPESLGWSMLNKQKFSVLCETLGIRAPRTAPDVADRDTAIRGLRPPLLVKPKEKVEWHDIRDALFGGAAKARIFRDADELLSHPTWPAFRDRVLVQEAIESPVGDLVSFHGFTSETGEMLAAFCGRKIRTFPAFAGESAYIELAEDASVAEEGRHVVKTLGLLGPFKIDFVRDPRDGKLYTLEINARFNLWHALGAAAGLNLPVIAYDYLTAHRLPSTAPRITEPKVKWHSFWLDGHALRETRAWDIRAYSELASAWIAGRLVHETFDITDPLPFAAWLGAFARDTIHNLFS